MTELRFPTEIAVGEVWWEDTREPGGPGHLLAIGVEVPDGAAVSLSVGKVAEAGVYGPGQTSRVTWQQTDPDSALRNSKSIWGGTGSYYVRQAQEPVDLEFLQGLPASSVCDLNVEDEIAPASFAAVAHLAPGLRKLRVNMDWLDDDALSVAADLPALESLVILGGSYTQRGLQRLGRLRNLQHLCIEKAGLPPAAFQFAATMPGLTRLTGPDEVPGSPMTPPQINQLRAMLPHISVC